MDGRDVPMEPIPDEVIADAPAEARVPEPPAAPQPNPATDVFVDLHATGEYTLTAAPGGEIRAREIFVDGICLEHCDEGPMGIWRYRARR